MLNLFEIFNVFLSILLVIRCIYRIVCDIKETKRMDKDAFFIKGGRGIWKAVLYFCVVNVVFTAVLCFALMFSLKTIKTDLHAFPLFALIEFFSVTFLITDILKLQNPKRTCR